MSSAGSVTKCIEGIKAGNDADFEKLWNRYRKWLVGFARKKLRGAPRRVADESDVADEALWSFYQGARAGKFPRLNDRDDLVGLLIVITMRKAADHIAFGKAKKRGGGKVGGGSAIRVKGSSDGVGSFDDLMQKGPGPVSANIAREEYDRLLGLLGDDTLRRIAEWSVAGFQIDEIAGKLGCARTTVFRKLRRIKKILLAEKS
jgi:DNA-directed RNA polymerase specialized sigma24 family protein